MVLITLKNNNVKCSYIDGDELDCAFCKFKGTDKCYLNK